MSHTRAARLATAIPAGPSVFLRSLIAAPTPASNACTMIIPTATASSQRLHPVANGTTLMIANAMLLAQESSASVRTCPFALGTDAMENPRPTYALTAVTVAQMRKDVVMSTAYFPCYGGHVIPLA